MPPIPESVREVLTAGRLAHLVTINPDGSPQLAIVWIGVEGDEIVSGHLSSQQQKLRNVRRDRRVALTVEARTRNTLGLDEYVVVHGVGRVTDGGGAELLQRLATVYLGPDVVFPPMPNPPDGHVLRITPTRFGGVGPWSG